MTLKTAAFLALVSMALLTVLLLLAFVRDFSSLLDGIVPAVQAVRSLIYLLAGLAGTVFFYAFHRDR
jgi:hypothetical protein